MFTLWSYKHLLFVKNSPRPMLAGPHMTRTSIPTFSLIRKNGRNKGDDMYLCSKQSITLDNKVYCSSMNLRGITK